MNPGSRLWKAYNAEIEKLRSVGEISDEDAHFLMLAQESRSALMDLTLGDDETYTEGTAMEIAGAVGGPSIKSMAAQVGSYSERVALDALKRLLGEHQAGSERQGEMSESTDPRR